ncbi:MAG: aspartate aminotransferase family protein [Bacteroidetes bacterium]|nr:MAG: aspartate aminotransferase family protein [Bacteroidota bacterium]
MESALAGQFRQHIAQTSPQPIGIEVVRAAGIYLYGPEGQRWIDFISGICVNNLGHGHPAVLAAIRQQSEAYLHPLVYGEGIMAPQVQYAVRLCELLDERLQTVYFVNSGAEAVEGAMKVARKYTGRPGIVACHQSYHGSTYGALTATGNDWMKAGYGPFLPGITHIPFNDFEALQAIDEQTAAFLVEPIQGAGGMVVPQPGYLQAAHRRCQEVGALMILDEIQTGFGRTGHLFAHQGMGFVPDILLLAKALGGGLPLGAFISSREIMSVIQRNPPLGHLTTYGGHPLSCAAGLAFLNALLDSRAMEQVQPLEDLMLSLLKHPGIVELRGMGLMYALLLKNASRAEQLRKAALQRGLLTIGFLGIDNGLRISPPLNMSLAEMNQACQILLECLDMTEG